MANKVNTKLASKRKVVIKYDGKLDEKFADLFYSDTVNTAFASSDRHAGMTLGGIAAQSIGDFWRV